ncbi:MAG: hypothetical protein ACFB4I_24795 [Cyanophyceae cyanobacterium]
MPWLSTMCNEASLVHWQQPEPNLPDWSMIHQRLSANGRFYQLANCSFHHANKIIPSPCVLKEHLILPRSDVGLVAVKE